MKSSNENFSLFKATEEKLFELRNAPRTYESKKGIKPSDLGSPCLTKNYYVYHRLQSNFPFDVKGIKARDSGDAFHGLVRKWYKEAGWLIENLDKDTGEVPISFIDKKTPDPEFPVYAPDIGVRYAKIDGI